MLPFMLAEIQDQYTADDNNRPWIVGFSGGKDSTMLLQLVWLAVAKLPAAQRHRPVYVVCNDTLVENPRIVGFIEATLQRIEAAAPAHQMPFVVVRTTPVVEQAFWFSLIGKGYPAPSSTFRWCTDRLKINPTTAFIKAKVSQAGEVIILLGTRSAESARRARSMAKHAVHGHRLRKHLLPNAYVYAPIRDVETAGVWQYLSQVPPPWGGTHKELITLYRNASTDEDCPLVVDTETPSCGKSRFGCYVCTVVKEDKSMKGLLQHGEEWMEPLADLRDYLVETRDNPERYRSKTLRRGYQLEGRWGPYLPEVRAEVLRRLLLAQREIQQGYDPTLSFISARELVAIQGQWHQDGIYDYSVTAVHAEVYPTAVALPRIQANRAEADALLREVCADEPDHYDLIQQSMKVLETNRFNKNRRGLYGGIERVLDNYLATRL
jgi:DNA sulfur modification protein DndC